MASVRVKFKPSAVEGKEGVIYYQIIQNCVSRQLKTDYRIYSEEWDEIGGNILVKATERRNFGSIRNSGAFVKLPSQYC